MYKDTILSFSTFTFTFFLLLLFLIPPLWSFLLTTSSVNLAAWEWVVNFINYLLFGVKCFSTYLDLKFIMYLIVLVCRCHSAYRVFVPLQLISKYLSQINEHKWTGRFKMTRIFRKCCFFNRSNNLPFRHGMSSVLFNFFAEHLITSPE